jgi:hypothetical protein
VGQLAFGEQRGQRVEQRPAGELVVVDAHDPVARALTVHPAEVPLHPRHRRQDRAPVREAADGPHDLRMRAALVQREEHLVDMGAPGLQQPSHLLRPAGRDDAQRQRRRPR